MNKEDKEFLKELQHEMLTQPTICQANPRFWVVRQTVREYGIDTEYDFDGWVIVGEDDEESRTDMESMYEWLHDTLEIDCELIQFTKDGFYIKIGEIQLIDENDVMNYIGKHTGYNQFNLVTYKDEKEIVPNTMFLTLRECEEHIKRNHYHYNEPSPYAMTAWRSPQVERLYKIIQNTNWEDI